MYSLSNLLHRWAIKLALGRPYPNPIPLSLPRAAANNFFVVELNEKSALVREMVLIGPGDPHAYQGLYFNEPTGSGYDVSVVKSQVHQYAFAVRHYLRGYQFRSESPLLFLLQQAVRYPQMVIMRDKTAQFLFNRKKLLRHDRIEILRVFVEKTTQDRAYKASSIGLLEDLQSLRSFSHPQRDEILGYYSLILDSFKQSGDLKLYNHAYALTGQGVTTLATYELEERRFTENLKQQRAVKYLTFVIIAVGLIQAAATWFAPTK